MIDTKLLVNKCSYCNCIQDPDNGSWINPADEIYSSLNETYKDMFSHGVCDPCMEKRSREILAYKLKKDLAKSV